MDTERDENLETDVGDWVVLRMEIVFQESDYERNHLKACFLTAWKWPIPQDEFLKIKVLYRK